MNKKRISAIETLCLGLAIFLTPVAVDLGFTFWRQTARPYLGGLRRSWGIGTSVVADSRARKYRVSHPVFHHTLAQNYDGIPEPWGKESPTLYTNSLGFKDYASREVELEGKQPRVLFIGDSFTEGWGYEWERTFVGRIQDHWKKKSIEVLNAGVSSYSPTIYYRKTKHFVEDVGLKFDHLVAFIDLSDIRDEEFYEMVGGEQTVRQKTSDVGSFRGLESHGHNPLTSFFISHSTLIRAALLSQRETKYGLGSVRGNWTLNPDSFKAFGERGLQQSQERMSELAELLRNNGISLSVAVYPWPDQIRARDLDSLQVRAWKGWAEKEGANFVNLFPSFIDETPWQTAVEKHFVRRDCHWNSLGHERTAKEFLRLINEEKIDFTRRRPPLTPVAPRTADLRSYPG